MKLLAGILAVSFFVQPSVAHFAFSQLKKDNWQTKNTADSLREWVRKDTPELRAISNEWANKKVSYKTQKDLERFREQKETVSSYIFRVQGIKDFNIKQIAFLKKNSDVIVMRGTYREKGEKLEFIELQNQTGKTVEQLQIIWEAKSKPQQKAAENLVARFQQ